MVERHAVERYVTPRLSTLGSLAELTLRTKNFGLKSDGDFLCEDGQDLYTVS